MKLLYILAVLFPVLACAALPTRLDNPVIFGSSAKPNGTNQDLGDTSHRWNLWTNFINGSAPLTAARTINTTAPLTGGGDLSADRTIAMPFATALVDGYLKQGDWSAFNSKEPAITATTSADYYRGDKTFQVLNTTAVPEGTNLYYTAARFNTAFGGKSTTDLAEGTNLYYTVARFNTAFGTKSTDDLSEGATNLYYTDSRFDTRLGTKSTTDLAEGTNLYYTAARFNTAFSGKTTADLTENTNLYYTAARFNTAFSGKSTTDLTEGTNLYYTDARARAAISGTAPISYNSTTGVVSCIVATGSVSGCLAAADFATFAAKQAALSTSTAVSNQFLTGFTAPNTFTRAQPAFSDLSGQATNAQLVNPATTVNGQTCTLGSTCTISTGSGTVTSASVVSANGLAGTVATATTTPAITLTTTVTGLVKGDGTALSAATSGTDYQAPVSTSSAVSNQFVTGFTAPNTFTRAQPSFSNLSGSATAAQMPAFTGDIATSAGSTATTLATVNSNVGSFTNANITVNAKGLITAASNGSGGGGGSTLNSALFTCGQGTAASGTTMLLNFNDTTTVYDFGTAGGSAWTINAGAALVSSPVKFGSGAIQVSGNASNATGRIQHAASATTTFGTGAFKIDAWINTSTNMISGGANYPIYSNYDAGSVAGTITFYYDGVYGGFKTYDGSTTQSLGTVTLATGTWYFLEFFRNAGTMSVYINSTLVGSVSNSTNLSNASNTVFIGGGTGFGGFNGYVDEFRISTTGSAAGSNPTTAYAISNTITSDPNTSISSVTGGSTPGVCTVNFVGAKYSTAPNCTAMLVNATAGEGGVQASGVSTTSSIGLRARVNGAAANSQVYMNCQ